MRVTYTGRLTFCFCRRPITNVIFQALLYVRSKRWLALLWKVLAAACAFGGESGVKHVS